MIRILIVDDHSVIRKLVGNYWKLSKAGRFAEKALTASKLSTRPCFFNRPLILILMTFASQPFSDESAISGARGFLSKVLAPDSLVLAIRALLRDELYFPQIA